jgi:hypothetical protein
VKIASLAGAADDPRYCWCWCIDFIATKERKERRDFYCAFFAFLCG